MGKENQYYQIVLENWCAPSYASKNKCYHGSLSDIGTLMRAVVLGGIRLNLDEIYRTYGRWTKGEHDICYPSDDTSHRFMISEEVIDRQDICLDDMTWVHDDHNGYSWLLHASSIRISQIVIKQGGVYIRCIRPAFQNLQYKELTYQTLPWEPVINRGWGFPHMMVWKDSFIIARLYMEQKRYRDADQAIADMRDIRYIDLAVAVNELICEEEPGLDIAPWWE